jgi:dTDP-4-dehydrorhamnose reductase
MRILLTGSTGYLGTALLRKIPIRHPDWDLHITLFSIVPADEMPNVHHLDLRDRESVARVMNTVKPDVIIHTAALNNIGTAEEMYATNAEGSGYLALEAGKHTSRLVHLSSDVIFDGARGRYTEDDSPNPITPYAVSKAAAEDKVQASGANAVLVRTSLIYGFKPLDPRTRAVLRGEMPRLFTDELRCPVWVDNLADALIELAESDYCGILNVAGTQVLNRYEFGVRLMDALKADTSQLIAARSDSSPTVRPLDCTLDVSRAQKVLKTRLMSVDEMLKLS